MPMLYNLHQHALLELSRSLGPHSIGPHSIGHRDFK